jgi:hypothetical protein
MIFLLAPNILMVIRFDLPGSLTILTLSLSGYKASPKTSYPGPRLAVEEGAMAIHDFILNLQPSILGIC